MVSSSGLKERPPNQELSRWGGAAALSGVALLLGSVVVVVSLGLPDASDLETLKDFGEIEPGRVAEHALYLGAVMLFALHALALHRLLTRFHPPAALFGTALAEFGYVIMAASSLLHLSTSPLDDLYTAPDASPEDLESIEHAWYAAQSVFDTMLTTGVLLVPIGIVLLGVAMRRSTPMFSTRLAVLAMGLGAIGIIGAAIAIVDPGSAAAAVSVLAIALFHLTVGWRTWALGNNPSIERIDAEANSVNGRY